MPDGDRVQNGNIALLIDADNASSGGLDQTLTILQDEIRRGMQLMGVTRVDQLSRDRLRRR